MNQVGKPYKIGKYIIEQINQDEYEITYPYSTGGYAKTIIVGGDFEIVLSTIFIGAKIEIKRNVYLKK